MSRITAISAKGIALIETFEGLRLKAYLDTGGVWTIGIGTTRYPNGKRVQPGDTCTRAQAREWCALDMAGACKDVDDLTRDDLTQNRFDALVSLVYNIGRGQFAGSTVRRLVNADPADPAIRAAFAMWKKDNGKVIAGLVRRRAAEADLYFAS